MFLGIDFGTSGARACVINAHKSILWELRVNYPDAATQTAMDWRDALYTLLGALPPTIANDLQTISIDGTSGTVLLCDERLEPIGPALLYNDSRASVEAAQLKTIAPENNIVCSATSSLAKFLWLTRHYPHTQHFLHQADWLTALLSGQPGISDYHNALKTGYDIEKLCWPNWILALPHADLLPQVVSPGAAIGKIQPKVAARFGITAKCVLYAGTTDSIAAFMASGIDTTGVGVTSLGTTLVLKQLSTVRIEAPECGIYSHRYGGLWLVGGASNAGAGVLRQYFDDARLTELSAQIDATQNSPLDYYPLPKAGERFPVYAPALHPRLTPRPPDDAAFLHGILQGLARIEATGYAKLAQLGAAPIKRVMSNGGGAHNSVWRQIRARILKLPVETCPHAEAAYGSALLGLKSMTYSPDANKTL
jgi:sugar (pentulose or hexulose) kinase